MYVGHNRGWPDNKSCNLNLRSTAHAQKRIFMLGSAMFWALIGHAATLQNMSAELIFFSLMLHWKFWTKLIHKCQKYLSKTEKCIEIVSMMLWIQKTHTMQQSSHSHSCSSWHMMARSFGFTKGFQAIFGIDSDLQFNNRCGTNCHCQAILTQKHWWYATGITQFLNGVEFFKKKKHTLLPWVTWWNCFDNGSHEYWWQDCLLWMILKSLKSRNNIFNHISIWIQFWILIFEAKKFDIKEWGRYRHHNWFAMKMSCRSIAIIQCNEFPPVPPWFYSFFIFLLRWLFLLFFIIGSVSLFKTSRTKSKTMIAVHKQINWLHFLFNLHFSWCLQSSLNM